jgi:glutamate synthase (NADPH/NADH) small chain
VTFKLGVDIGKNITFAELRTKHDAILVATGVYKSKELGAPGSEAKGVHKALDYLIAANKVGLGSEVADFTSGKLNADKKNVVVIGGGDTAMDCVRTAIRQGAKSVTCLYRRDRANMPGSQREVANAEEEGVKFDWLAAPLAVSEKKSAGAKAVRVIRMRLGPPDASGRQAPEEIPDSDYDVRADMVIKALGFDPEDLPKHFSENSLTVNRWGGVKVDYRTMMTTMDGVFAAGDIVRGASLVVWAIKEGRDAAASIDTYLKARAASARVAAE